MNSRQGSFSPLRPMSSDVEFLKFGHSISLDGHNVDTKETVPTRNARVLLSRGSSYPKLPPDLSAEFTNENIKRRTVHRDILTADSTSFRRVKIPEGTDIMLKERIKLKDYLSDMHKLKDMDDINTLKKSRLTFSRRRFEEAKEHEDMETYKYNTMKPIEDFVQPENPDFRRSTGYEPGNIRSLLKLDVFGPASSKRAEHERAIGKAPPSPNVNRIAVVESRVNSAERASSAGTRHSSASESTYNSYEFARVKDRKHMKSKRSLRLGTKPEFDSVDLTHMRDMFHESSNQIPDDKVLVNFMKTFNNPITSDMVEHNDPHASRVKPGTLGFHGNAISTADRLPMDPLLKRTLWFKTYQKNEKDKKHQEELALKEKKYRKAQKNLAKAESQAMKDFEKKLFLARLEV